MRPDLPDGEANVPADWWGPAWSPHPKIGFGRLIETGLVPLDLAALLSLLIDRGASVVVAAGPSGAGKSTLLTALVELLPQSKRRVYARGMHETFDFAENVPPESIAILVNEMSAHLPIYLWGPAVKRLFELGRAGFQFFATCHAETVEEVVYSFSAYPLRIPVRGLSSIDILIFLKAWRAGREVRREIDRVVSLRGDDPAGVEAIPLYADGAVSISGVTRAFGFDAAATGRFENELERRAVELRARASV